MRSEEKIQPQSDSVSIEDRTDQDRRTDSVTDVVQVAAVVLFGLGMAILKWFNFPFAEESSRNLTLVFYGAVVFIMVPITLKFLYRLFTLTFG